MRRYFDTLVFATLFSSMAFAAEITVSTNDDVIKRGSIFLTGPIQKGDARAIEMSIASAQGIGPRIREVFLDSPGGEVEEAFKIGRLIRKHELDTVLPMNASCLSSCVFVLAAGVNKWRFGLVGIHRPYFTATPIGDIDSGIKQLLTAAENYLNEMNIPKSLAEEMFSTQPSDIRYLTNEDIERYRLDQPDMAYQEKEDLAEAKRLGLTRVEYMRRMKLAEEQENACFKQRPDDDGAWQLKCIDSVRRKLGLE